MSTWMETFLAWLACLFRQWSETIQSWASRPVAARGTKHPARGRLPHPSAMAGSAPASVRSPAASAVAQSLTDGFARQHSRDAPTVHHAPESADGVTGTNTDSCCRAAAMRRTEFGRLDGTVYADHAGTTLYTDRQLQEVYQDLAGSVLGNPHSKWGGPAGFSAIDAAARQVTLDMCGAAPGEYECVFTSGATGALKLVGEAFPWTRDSCFAYTRDNHNSVLGIREQALSAGASALAVDPEPSTESAAGWTLRPASAVMSRSRKGASGAVATGAATPGSAARPAPMDSTGKPAEPAQQLPDNTAVNGRGRPGAGSEPAPWHLFAYPLESNFSGVRYDEALGNAAAAELHESPAAGTAGREGDAREGLTSAPRLRRGRWAVLLDAAKGCGSRPPNLSKNPVDFVAISFYKIFGYPTGLGALLVRRAAMPLLAGKLYFGGGTVAVSCADADVYRRRDGPIGLEDGTTAFLAIASLRHGFAAIRRAGGFQTISAHARAVTQYCAAQLATLRHGNGEPVCVLYGAHHTAPSPAQARVGPVAGKLRAAAAGQGPVVAFNVLRDDTTFVGYREVEQVAALNGVRLRAGCFCNPGCCAGWLGLTAEAMVANYRAGRVCWDDTDLVDGYPTGAVRVSFGYMSSFEDADAVVRVLRDFFVTRATDLDDGDAALTAAGCAARSGGEPSSQGAAGSRAACGCQLPPGAASALASSDPQAEHGDGSQRRRSTAGNSDSSPDAPTTATPQWGGNGSGLRGSGKQASAWDETFAVVSSPEEPGTPTREEGGGGGFSRVSAMKTWLEALGTESGAANGMGHAGDTVNAAQRTAAESRGMRVQGLWLYPVKSCAGQAVTTWQLGPNGLLYDREWALIDPDGRTLSQRRHPSLTQIRPLVDPAAGELIVSAPGMPDLRIRLSASGVQPDKEASATSAEILQPSSRQVQVLGDRVSAGLAAAVGDDGSSAAAWFTAAVGVPCTLVRQLQGARTPVLGRLNRSQPGAPPVLQQTSAAADSASAASGQQHGCVKAQTEQAGSIMGQADGEPGLVAISSSRGGGDSIGFANEAQFLLVNAESVREVARRVAAKAGAVPAEPPMTDAQLQVEVARYRPNILVGGGGLQPFAEDAWQEVALGPHRLTVDGPCTRCEMVCTDQQTGRVSGSEPLLTLAAFRRRRGRITFGLLLRRSYMAAQASTASSSEGQPQHIAIDMLAKPRVHVTD